MALCLIYQKLSVILLEKVLSSFWFASFFSTYLFEWIFSLKFFNQTAVELIFILRKNNLDKFSARIFECLNSPIIK